MRETQPPRFEVVYERVLPPPGPPYEDWSGKLLGIVPARRQVALQFTRSWMGAREGGWQDTIEVRDYQTDRRVGPLRARRENSDKPREYYGGSRANEVVVLGMLSRDYGARLGVRASADGRFFVTVDERDDGSRWVVRYTPAGRSLGPLAPATQLAPLAEPAISEDSRWVAYRGDFAPRGHSELVVARLDGGAPLVIDPEITADPVWADADTLYAPRHRGYGRSDGQVCLIRVDVDSSGARASELDCHVAWSSVSPIVVSPSRETAVLAFTLGDQNVNAGGFVWFRLADGEVLASHRVDGSCYDQIFVDDTRLLIPQHEHITLLSLRTGNRMHVPEAMLGGEVEGWTTAVEDGVLTVFALRRPEPVQRRFQVVRVRLPELD